jgi:AcrR family transcriptional regulator
MSSNKNEATRRRNDPRDRSTLRKAERTRQAILDAALKFLWSHPFRDLTIAELMGQTGVSRSGFYQYFADLHGLMEHLLDDLEEEVLEVAKPWFSTEENGASQLAETLSGVVDVCYKRGPILRAVVEAAPMDERLEQAWKKFLKVFDRAVADRIRLEQANSIAPEFDADAMAIALNRMDVATLIYHFGQRPRSKPEPVFRTLTRVWISTIYGWDALVRLEET